VKDGVLVMVLYCDVLVLVYMELDFGELVCNQLVSNCREHYALDGGLDEALDEGYGALVLEVESEGLEGRWTCQSSSILPQDSSGGSL